MTARELLDQLARTGVRIRRDGDDLDVEGPATSLTSAVVDQIRQHKAALLALLPDASSPPPPETTVLTPRDGFCVTHNRYLVYGENAAVVCWWCSPERAPNGHAIHSLTADELARLVVVVRGTP